MIKGFGVYSLNEAQSLQRCLTFWAYSSHIPFDAYQNFHSAAENLQTTIGPISVLKNRMLILSWIRIFEKIDIHALIIMEVFLSGGIRGAKVESLLSDLKPPSLHIKRIKWQNVGVSMHFRLTRKNHITAILLAIINKILVHQLYDSVNHKDHTYFTSYKSRSVAI